MKRKILPIQFACPDVGKAEIRKMKEVVNSGWLTNGPVVREFEAKLKEMSNASRAVAVDSCTAAMELSLRALGIGPGDEVITTPYTYSATADVIRNVGAKIVFVDLGDTYSFEMDYGKMADAITERTKAIIPVDLGGVLCDYEQIYMALDSKRELFKPANQIQEAMKRPAVIADAAHSFMAEGMFVTMNAYRPMVSGEIADFTCFSFHVLKNITTGGEGGAVVWKDLPGIDNAALEETIRLLADHGQTSRDKSKGWEYDIRLFGLNHIMTNIDAAMGLAQIQRLPEIADKRRHVTIVYDMLFKAREILPLISHFIPTSCIQSVSACHLYPVFIPDGGTDGDAIRNGVYDRMKAAGVPCNVHYKPLPMMTAYKQAGYDIADYPNAYNLFRHVLTVPYHTKLTIPQQIYIANQLEEAIDEELRANARHGGVAK